MYLCLLRHQHMEEPLLEAVSVVLDTVYNQQIEAIYRKTVRFLLQHVTGSDEPPALANGAVTVIRVNSASNS